ncbi:MAG: poly-gamma-glutamate biosynthesis protein PgsC [Oscillospiraceae bacterium]
MNNEIVLLGIAVSLIFSELTGLSPAGLVVPGYIALCLQTPSRILYTFVVVFLTWGVARLLSNVMILYGRRRFAVMILLSFLINLAIVKLGVLPHNPGVIGSLIPGIMAQEWEKQGIVKSTLSLMIAVGIIALIMMLCNIPVLPI